MTVKSSLEAAANPDTNFKLWLDELTAAQKWLKPWWDQARKASDRFSNKTANSETMIGPARGRRYNIFAANVDVLSAALYATPPTVAVSRKFDDYEDDVARVAATIVQRIIEQDLLDYTNNFHAVCTQVVQDRLVPGMGTAWLRVEMDPTGKIPSVKIDHVQWADFIFSPCDTWENRRWTGRRVVMTYDEGVLRFGDVFKNVPPTSEQPVASAEQSLLGTPVLEEAEVFEIWDRDSKKVMWLNPNYPTFLDVKDDYLNIRNFEPTPKPFFATLLNEVCRPLPDYIRWIEQYNELDEINQRISMLVKACKAVGVYDKAQKGVQRLMQEGTDNTLIPVDDWAMFAEKGGLKGVIDWLPLETIVAAQDTLRKAREDVKAQIYELTGISDVVRGTSNPHETLGAQRLKADYASSRIQVLQGDFEAWVTHVLTIKAEIVVMQFPAETLLQQSNILNTPDKDLAPQAIGSLKDGDFFNFRIIIEPLSMAQIDYTQEKTDRLEFMSAMGNFIEKAILGGEKAPELIPLMAAMIQFAVAGFRVSSTIEGTIDKTLQKMVDKQLEAEKNPAPAKPTPEDIKAQELQQKMQIEQQKAALDMQKLQMQLENDKASNALEMIKMQQELKLQQQESKLKLAEIEAKMLQEQKKADLELAKLAVELRVTQQQAIVDTNIATMQAETARMQETNNLVSQAADLEHQDMQRTHDGVMMDMKVEHERAMMDKESESEDENESGEDDASE
jgi:hypothetical protein